LGLAGAVSEFWGLDGAASEFWGLAGTTSDVTGLSVRPRVRANPMPNDANRVKPPESDLLGNVLPIAAVRPTRSDTE